MAPRRVIKELAPAEVRAAIADLCRIAAVWESGALRRGSPDTRAADEQLLRAIVDAIGRHQSAVPVARSGRHLVRRIDIRLTRVHAQVADVLRDVQADLDAAETIDRLHAAFTSGGIKGVTRERVSAVFQRFMARSHPVDWITAHRGPEQAAADFMSAVGPRSGRYPFLVKQLLEHTKMTSPADLETLARGKLVTRRELLTYVLSLAGLSNRQISRILDSLHRPHVRARLTHY